MSKTAFIKQSRLALTGISIAFLLAACGGGGSSSDSSENQADTPAAADSGNSATENLNKAITGEWKAILFVPDRNSGPDKQVPFQFTIFSNGTIQFRGSPVSGGTCSGTIGKALNTKSSGEIQFSVGEDCFGSDDFIPTFNPNTDQITGFVHGFGGLVDTFIATRA